MLSFILSMFQILAKWVHVSFGHQLVVAISVGYVLHCLEQILVCNRTDENANESSKSRLSLISGKCGSRKKLWRKCLQVVSEHPCSWTLRAPYGTDSRKNRWLQGCRFWTSGRGVWCSRSFLGQRCVSLFSSQSHPLKQEKLVLIPFPENFLLTFCK